MGMTSKPNRAVFLAMEDLGLTGWLPGSARRLAVRTGRGENVPIQSRGSSESSMERRGEVLPVMSAQTRAAWLVVATAVGAITLVTLASALLGRRK